jgi:putative ABC transport system substrate-binding protein
LRFVVATEGDRINKAQRRKFLLASSAFLAAPLASFGQPAEKMRRIAILGLGSRSEFASQRFQQRLRASLRGVGYEEGRNLIIERRNADGELERLPALADELVRLKVELIVAPLNVIPAAKRATRTIPIVMHSALNPVENGFVESLARPGGNVTGTMWTGSELGGKIVQVLKEAHPGAVRVAVLFNPTSPGEEARVTESHRAAKALRISLQEFRITRAKDIAGALDRISAIRPDALIVFADSNSNSRAREIADFATQRKLVSIGTSSLHVEAGGLIFYGPDISALYDRTASFIDRILRGAKPSDLPVEGPTKYELVINAKTAQAIGFKLPQAFLVGVDRQIE